VPPPNPGATSSCIVCSILAAHRGKSTEVLAIVVPGIAENSRLVDDLQLVEVFMIDIDKSGIVVAGVAGSDTGNKGQGV